MTSFDGQQNIEERGREREDDLTLHRGDSRADNNNNDDES